MDALAQNPGNVQAYDNLMPSKKELDAQCHCFCTGTMISTVQGDKPVENLSTADHVITATGKCRQIKEISREDILFPKGYIDKRNSPVKILKDALADNVPYRDLYLSPAHALGFDATITRFLLGKKTKRVIIRSAALINHKTIMQLHVPWTTYWHITLKDHDLILANGVPAETFQDRREIEDRTFGTFKLIYNHKMRRRLQARSIAPRLKQGPYVMAIRERIESRMNAHFQNDVMLQKTSAI